MRWLALLLLHACAAPASLTAAPPTAAPPTAAPPTAAPPTAAPPTTPAPAPPPLTATSPIARADLAADLAVLRDTFEALHPGLDRYTTRAARDAAYAAILDDAGPSPTLASTFLALSRFTAKLRCGHTHANPYNQLPAVQAALFTGPRVPFLFRWIDGRIVVTRSLTADPGLPPGAEIVALDGRPTADLLADLLPLARADGSNDAKRIASLELRGDDRFAAFDLFTGLLDPRPADAPYRLDVRNPDNTITSIEVAPMTAAARAAALPSDGDPAAPPWALTFLDRHTGYLHMPTWAVYDRPFDWKADLDRTIATLVQRKARRLILDLRGNEGGLDVGHHLLRHLLRKPLPLGGLVRRVRYRAVPDALRPPLDTWDPSFFDWGADARDRDDGWYDLAGDGPSPLAEILTPLAPRFRGRLIVLVDAANSSATFQFAQLVQRHRLGTLVGTPTGGNQRGINGGAFFFLRLPRTQLEIDLPLIARVPLDGNLAALPDAGLVPDLLAPVLAADLARGHDAALARALR